MNNIIEVSFPKQYEQMMAQILKELKEVKQELSTIKNTQKLLKRSEASKYLGITWQQLESISYCKGEGKEKENRKIPYTKVGKNYSYLLSDLEEYKKKFIL